MRLVISILATIGLIRMFLYLIDQVNEKQNNRCKQFPYPIIALVYSIVVVVLLTLFVNDIQSLFQKAVSIKLLSFLPAAYIIVLNILLMAGFVVVKLIARLPVRKIWSDYAVVDATSSFVYLFNEKTETWLLRLRFSRLRTVLRAIVTVLWIVSAFVLGLTIVSGDIDLRIFAFPCAALIIMNEVYQFINGLTEEEFCHNVSGEDIASVNIRNDFKLREIYEKLLPDPLRTSITEFNMRKEESVVDEMEALSKSEDVADRFTYQYFNVNNRYFKADRDYIEITRKLMHRENIVCFDPFYKDMGTYITLPVVSALMAGKKVMVVTGKLADRDKIGSWFRDTLAEYSHLKSLWNINNLTSKIPDCEIGMVSFPQLYDSEFITSNREFFDDTDMVIMFEPSGILSTGQMALSIISHEFERNEQKPVYFICDRYADGLVDTISHVMRSEFTDVTPTQAPKGIYTGMIWDADGDFDRRDLFDKQTQYLGNGVELASIAIRNQIPHVTWYSRSKMPVRDAKWIAGQDYDTICKYMGIPSEQTSLHDRIGFESDVWGAEREDTTMLIAEDEFTNIFSLLRNYQSRGQKQSFVHIISENYMMRDYMCDNADVFHNNPHAIPSLVSDYAKTERNTLFMLLTIMSIRPVFEKEIIDEFHLVGVETDDAEKTITEMMSRYTHAPEDIINKKEHEDTGDTFTISHDNFDAYFAESLKNAYYIVENEEHDEEYIDARMYSHVTQTVLPGQLMTYDGKYYLVKHVSPESGVVLHRASNMFDDRRYYRQIRKYSFNYDDIESRMLDSREVMGIGFTSFYTDIDVETTGYLDMNDPHDFASAKSVEIKNDYGTVKYTRAYHNKKMLRVSLPDIDSEVKSLIVLLLNELLRTVYPDCWPYIAVIANHSQKMTDLFRGVLADGELPEEDNNIYFIEDSDLDIGVIDSVERNYMDFMKILTEYLTWDMSKSGNKKYCSNRYLRFGYDDDLSLPIVDTKQYLMSFGWDENPLTRARECDPKSLPVIDLEAINHCDFCGMPINGISYEVLSDGRTRCQDCSRTVIRSSEDLTKLFNQILELMESLYGVRYDKPINVSMIDAKKMGRITGALFTPSTEMTGRVLGLAVQTKEGGYNVLIENGSPRLAAISAMVHELTHIWQYLNWNEADLARTYGVTVSKHTELDFLYEGMACWASIQYLYLIGESSYAAEQEALMLARDDVYGEGFKMFCSQYPLIKNFDLVMDSPFMRMPPLNPDLSEIVVIDPETSGIQSVEADIYNPGDTDNEQELSKPAEADVEPEPEMEPEADIEPGPEVEPEADIEPESEVEPEADIEPEPEMEPEADIKPEPEVEPEADVEDEPKVEADSSNEEEPEN